MEGHAARGQRRPGATKEQYTYDGFDRVTNETHDAISKVTEYDALDRPVKETLSQTGATSRITRLTYLGTSKQVAAELKPATGGGWSTSKVFNYGPDGKPLMMVKDPSGSAVVRYYSTNPRGDIETLTHPSTGETKATYRYRAYGDPDDAGTLGEDKKTTPTAGQLPDEPLNPYRYNAKRVDPATGNIDMGFRTYDPGLNTFLTRDMYNGALDDLCLGVDPWNANRYAFAGGNPVTHVELDGHLIDGGNGNTYNQGESKPGYKAPTYDATQRNATVQDAGQSASVETPQTATVHSDAGTYASSRTSALAVSACDMPGWFEQLSERDDWLESQPEAVQFLHSRAWGVVDFFSARGVVSSYTNYMEGDRDEARDDLIGEIPPLIAEDARNEAESRWGYFGKHSKETGAATRWKAGLRVTVRLFGVEVSAVATVADYVNQPIRPEDCGDYQVTDDPRIDTTGMEAPAMQQQW